MKEFVTNARTESTLCWQAMEEMARRHVQQWLQGLLEEEVTESLGRSDTAASARANAGIATVTARRGS